MVRLFVAMCQSIDSIYNLRLSLKPRMTVHVFPKQTDSGHGGALFLLAGAVESMATLAPPSGWRSDLLLFFSIAIVVVLLKLSKDSNFY